MLHTDDYEFKNLPLPYKGYGVRNPTLNCVYGVLVISILTLTFRNNF